MFLYSSFNPVQPRNHLIAGNDDIVNFYTADGSFSENNNFRSILSLELIGNVTYTLVVTSFQSNVTGTLTFEINGPGSVEVTPNEHSTGYTQNSTLNPTSAAFDKYDQSNGFKDVVTTITLNGNTLNDILLNGTSIGVLNYT